MKKFTTLLLLCCATCAVLAGAFSLNDPTMLKRVSHPVPAPTGITSLDNISGLLVEYVADPIYFNGDYAGAGVTSWNPKAGSMANTLQPNGSYGTPSFDAAGLAASPCVIFTGNELMQAGFNYTGEKITYVYVGDFDPDFFNTGGNQGGYPRVASLANYGNGEEDYTSTDVGIAFYSTGGGQWQWLRGGDSETLDLSGNPDNDKRVITILKQNDAGVWKYNAYFTDGSVVSGSVNGESNPYNTDTLNLGGNQEPNLAVFKAQHFAIYDNGVSDADEAKIVAYLKLTHW
jgi:hypothetical protein